MLKFWLIALLLITALVLFLIFKKLRRNRSTSKAVTTNYDLYIKDPFNQPQSYPIAPLEESERYQPIGEWQGRLILSEGEVQDCIQIEVYHAPKNFQNLVGKTVKLTWLSTPITQRHIQFTTTNIQFNQQTAFGKKINNLHPDRLDGLKQVGPLKSIAGARTKDDVIVQLLAPVAVSDNPTTLSIEHPPVQITGRSMALVTIVKRVPNTPDRFEVRHFNRTSQAFDGTTEIVRIPQVGPDRSGILRSTTNGLETSPVNPKGWYIYGAKDAEGLFVVQALEPRSIMRLIPDKLYLGLAESIRYIKQVSWENTEAQKGKASTALLDTAAKTEAQALAQWQEGDRALVMHLFGGIGGKKGEGKKLGVVTGHFAYGFAEVVRDSFSPELRWKIDYCQVYAHNPDGIISGSITWASYLGDLQRGWAGDRPVADALIQFDAITQDYDFDGIRLSPLDELRQQLEIFMARYRSGDGDGAAIATPATSCVQDSNQALYVTIQRIKMRVATNTQIQAWLKANPTHPQTQRLQQLQSLLEALEHLLVPLGVVRPDWKENAIQLAGILPIPNLLDGAYKTAASWKTMIPRGAYDAIAQILLEHGAKLWVIRTNQIGGFDPDIAPYAPTVPFKGE